MKFPFISRKKYKRVQMELAEKDIDIEKLKLELIQAKDEFQKLHSQDEKIQQINNLKLKIEEMKRELERQKSITHFKNQIINGLKGETEPRKDLEEKYSKVNS